jgi:hypothetical protein
MTSKLAMNKTPRRLRSRHFATRYLEVGDLLSCSANSAAYSWSIMSGKSLQEVLVVVDVPALTLHRDSKAVLGKYPVSDYSLKQWLEVTYMHSSNHAAPPRSTENSYSTCLIPPRKGSFLKRSNYLSASTGAEVRATRRESCLRARQG